MAHLVYLSLGSNQGDRRGLLEKAIELLNTEVGTVEAVSTFLETEPWGFDSVFPFLNIAVRMRTEFSPFELLKATQTIEQQLGRKHKSKGGLYQDRLIDIDILIYDTLNITTEELTIPHPLMQERDFVMIPLSQIFLTPEEETILVPV